CPPCDTQQPLHERLHLSVTDIIRKAGKNGSPLACRFSKRLIFSILFHAKLYINFHTNLGWHSNGARNAVLNVAI
ncbi:MAG: hypothetical protein LBR84_00570, partial [Tannerella sp.]|nr:hypothetical protein [Tannerella sp.]